MGHGAAEIHDAFMAVVLFGAYHIYNCVHTYIIIKRFTHIHGIYTCKTVKTPKLWCFILVKPRNERLPGGHIMPTFAMLIHIYTFLSFFPLPGVFTMLGKSVRLWREIGVSRLFIRYQIPSDLFSFSDDLLLPGESATPEKQLQLVKGQVEALFLVDGSGVINSD